MTNSVPGSGGGEYTEVPPAGLAEWLDRFADRHQGLATVRATDRVVVLRAGDGTLAHLEIPNPPLDLPACRAADPVQVVVLLAGLVDHVLDDPAAGPVRIHLRRP